MRIPTADRRTALGRWCGAMKMETSSISPFIVLRDLPGIAEIEAVLTTPGAWLLPVHDNLSDRVNEVSISLFGITEADTIRPAPSIDDYLTPEHAAIMARGDGIPFADLAYTEAPMKAAYDEQIQWERNFDVLYDEEDQAAFWTVLGIDVNDANREQLECLHDFSRQLIVLARGLMPAAQFTPDGSGKRVGQPPRDWAASLEAQAAEFMKRRRK